MNHGYHIHIGYSRIYWSIKTWGWHSDVVQRCVNALVQYNLSKSDHLEAITNKRFRLRNADSLMHGPGNIRLVCSWCSYNPGEWIISIGGLQIT